MGKVITFFNDKGGVGKTTLTALFACYLAYRRNKRVIVIDFDYPNYRLRMYRQKDRELIESDPSSALARCNAARMAELKQRNNGVEPKDEDKYFPLYTIKDEGGFSEDLLSNIRRAIEINKEKCDYLLLDLPGRFLEKDPAHYIIFNGVVDFIIVPITADSQTQDAAYSLYQRVHSDTYKATSGKESGQRMAFLWNNINADDRKRNIGLSSRNEANQTLLNVDFISHKLNSIPSLTRDSSYPQFIRNTICYPVQNIKRVCRNIELIFTEMMFRIDDVWTEKLEKQLYNGE